jgi:hypothetical protein
MAEEAEVDEALHETPHRRGPRADRAAGKGRDLTVAAASAKRCRARHRLQGELVALPCMRRAFAHDRRERWPQANFHERLESLGREGRADPACRHRPLQLLGDLPPLQAEMTGHVGGLVEAALGKCRIRRREYSLADRQWCRRLGGGHPRELVHPLRPWGLRAHQEARERHLNHLSLARAQSVAPLRSRHLGPTLPKPLGVCPDERSHRPPV